MKSHILFITIIFILSCQSQRESNDTKTFKTEFPEVNDEFSSYLENFKKAELPIEIKGCSINESGLKMFNDDKYKKYNKNLSLAYKQIPTNGNYIATITLGIADCNLPILTTYKLTGEIIDCKTLSIGYCGSDCGYSCEEFMKINSNYSIFVADTISSYECDSIGQEIPGTYEYYTMYKTGKLLNNGLIELSEETKKILDGRKNEP